MSYPSGMIKQLLFNNNNWVSATTVVSTQGKRTKKESN